MMKSLMMGALALGWAMPTIVWAPPAMATATLYATEGPWKVLKRDEGCALVREYSEGKRLYVVYDYNDDDVITSIQDPRYKSIVDGKKYQLRLLFTSNQTVHDEWGEVEALGVIHESGVGAFMVRTTAKILDDIAKDATIAFFRGDAIVDAFPLDGSAKAILKIKQCAIENDRDHPGDPFAD